MWARLFWGGGGCCFESSSAVASIWKACLDVPHRLKILIRVISGKRLFDAQDSSYDPSIRQMHDGSDSNAFCESVRISSKMASWSIFGPKRLQDIPSRSENCGKNMFNSHRFEIYWLMVIMVRDEECFPTNWTLNIYTLMNICNIIVDYILTALMM